MKSLANVSFVAFIAFERYPEVRVRPLKMELQGVFCLFVFTQSGCKTVPVSAGIA
ncbi:hypothetical protein [Pannonibacter phragmitetus]|uniref:hypothetical protein n=1 Tax=Pannonibacter phragmitetus TaxID=121719 RepID=UPI0013DE6005|nr:hypothetical protein [Pannonibacter phragmitetus]